jgi:hypothetical protein
VRETVCGKGKTGEWIGWGEGKVRWGQGRTGEWKGRGEGNIRDVVKEGPENGKGGVRETVQRCGTRGSKKWKGLNGWGKSKRCGTGRDGQWKDWGEENSKDVVRQEIVR